MDHVPIKTSIYAGFAMATFDYKPPAGHGPFGDIHTFRHVRLGFPHVLEEQHSAAEASANTSQGAASGLGIQIIP